MGSEHLCSAHREQSRRCLLEGISPTDASGLTDPLLRPSPQDEVKPLKGWCLMPAVTQGSVTSFDTFIRLLEVS